ncbi:ROK family protein [Streptomyces sp. NBC_01518]|uniref:ROK family protein n=1 Tax=Streptomyces sp. NBC_01518 TaxID=2903891 RepID=UPI0038630E79
MRHGCPQARAIPSGPDARSLEARLAITDLAQNRLASLDIPVDLAQGPEAVLKQLEAALKELHASVGGILATGDRGGVPDGESGDLCAVTIGLPGPVDHAAGIPVRPPIMPGWDGYPVGQVLSERFGCPVLVDNDANLMALGEARTLPGDQLPLLFVTVSTGIGGGLVSAEGELHRGADGAAGDIGHLPVRGADDVVCRCGNTGCVEAVASAAAMIGRLERERAARPGSLTESAEDALTGEQELARLIRHGDPAALRIVRDAAEHIGEVVALLVHVCKGRPRRNPGERGRRTGGKGAGRRLPSGAATGHEEPPA